MSQGKNTLLLRLAGPMQSWGTSSRFQLRRTDMYPSKSGVLGLLLCAMGIRREDSTEALRPLTTMCMGVRVDHAGTSGWDYHTAGAKIGIRSAEGKIKRTQSTGVYETLLSRRQYLYDASFLVALSGPVETIQKCVEALNDPAWPVFLGRKCCVPTEPILAGVGVYDSLTTAFAAIPWKPRIEAIDDTHRNKTRLLDIYVEHMPGTPPPPGSKLVYDVPYAFGYYSYGGRWIAASQVTVPTEEPMQENAYGTWKRRVDYASQQWKDARRARLEWDNHLCVFCKSPATDVHHVDYTNVGQETNDDLRSLCKICHDACTMLEYGHDMRERRIDPLDVTLRPAMLQQIARLLSERRLGRRRDLLENACCLRKSFFDDIPDMLSAGGD